MRKNVILQTVQLFWNDSVQSCCIESHTNAVENNLPFVVARGSGTITTTITTTF